MLDCLAEGQALVVRVWTHAETHKLTDRLRQQHPGLSAEDVASCIKQATYEVNEIAASKRTELRNAKLRQSELVKGVPNKNNKRAKGGQTRMPTKGERLTAGNEVASLTADVEALKASKESAVADFALLNAAKCTQSSTGRTSTDILDLARTFGTSNFTAPANTNLCGTATGESRPYVIIDLLYDARTAHYAGLVFTGQVDNRHNRVMNVLPVPPDGDCMPHAIMRVLATSEEARAALTKLQLAPPQARFTEANAAIDAAGVTWAELATVEYKPSGWQRHELTQVPAKSVGSAVHAIRRWLVQLVLDHPTSVCTHGSPDGAAHGPDSLHDDCRQQWQQLIRMAVAGATDPQQLPDGLRQCYKTIANAVQVASDWDSKKAITAAAVWAACKRADAIAFDSQEPADESLALTAMHDSDDDEDSDDEDPDDEDVEDPDGSGGEDAAGLDGSLDLSAGDLSDDIPQPPDLSDDADLEDPDGPSDDDTVGLDDTLDLSAGDLSDGGSPSGLTGQAGGESAGCAASQHMWRSHSSPEPPTSAGALQSPGLTPIPAERFFPNTDGDTAASAIDLAASPEPDRPAGSPWRLQLSAGATGRWDLRVTPRASAPVSVLVPDSTSPSQDAEQPTKRALFSTYDDQAAAVAHMQLYPSHDEIQRLADEQDHANVLTKTQATSDLGHATVEVVAAQDLEPGQQLGIYYGDPKHGDATGPGENRRYMFEMTNRQGLGDIYIDAVDVRTWPKEVNDRRPPGPGDPSTAGPNVIVQCDWTTPDGNDALFPRMVVGDNPIREGEVLRIYYGPDFDRSWEGSGRTDSTQWESGHAEAHGPNLSGIIGSEPDEVDLAGSDTGSTDAAGQTASSWQRPASPRMLKGRPRPREPDTHGPKPPDSTPPSGAPSGVPPNSTPPPKRRRAIAGDLAPGVGASELHGSLSAAAKHRAHAVDVQAGVIQAMLERVHDGTSTVDELTALLQGSEAALRSIGPPSAWKSQHAAPLAARALAIEAGAAVRDPALLHTVWMTVNEVVAAARPPTIAKMDAPQLSVLNALGWADASWNFGAFPRDGLSPVGSAAGTTWDTWADVPCEAKSLLRCLGIGHLPVSGCKGGTRAASVAPIYDRMAVAMAGQAGGSRPPTATAKRDRTPPPAGPVVRKTKRRSAPVPPGDRAPTRLDADGDHGPDGGVTAALIQ